MELWQVHTPTTVYLPRQQEPCREPDNIPEYSCYKGEKIPDNGKCRTVRCLMVEPDGFFGDTAGLHQSYMPAADGLKKP